MQPFKFFFSPILLQINPSDYIPSFIKFGWGVAEKIMEESQMEMDKLLLLIGYYMNLRILHIKYLVNICNYRKFPSGFRMTTIKLKLLDEL